MTELLGQTIGHCRIEALLGSGGMGRVFRARHVNLNRLQAIKVLHDEFARDSGFQARFSQEARSIAALDHDHIVEIYDFNQQDGRFFLSMELLADGSLRTLLERRTKQNQRWPLAFSLDLLRQAADALAYAHGKGIVHRDIKPDNLLLLRRNNGRGETVYTVKVSDFGLVRLAEGSGLTASGLTVGTPHYMSPEQCQGLELDGRSDVYALGVVLYELLTGYLPFATRTISEAIRKHVQEPPPPPRQVNPDIPVAVEALILRCLAKRPDERFSSAAELSTALRELISPSPPPKQAAAHHVQVLDAAGQTIKAVTLSSGSLTVGRLAGNDLVLDNPLVSRNHLRIEWNGQQARVIDLGARAGTQLNGVALTPQKATPWSVGQTLGLGPYGLRLALGPAVEQLRLTLGPGQEALMLTPGTATLVQVRLSSSVPTPPLAVALEGLPAPWVQLPSHVLQLAPGTPMVLALTIAPPRLPESTAGERAVTIRVSAHDGSAVLGSVQARWMMAPFAAGKLVFQNDRGYGRSDAAYVLGLTNDGNAPARYLLSAADPQRALSYRCEPAEVELEPGQSAQVQLTVQVERRLLGIARRHSFTVQATTGDTTLLAKGEFIQSTLVPDWIVAPRDAAD